MSLILDLHSLDTLTNVVIDHVTTRKIEDVESHNSLHNSKQMGELDMDVAL